MRSSTLPSTWPRPLRLLCAALAQASGAGQDWHDQAAALAQGMTLGDWDRFADLAIREHRVAPVIAQVVKGLDMPAPALAQLDKAIRLNAFSTLTQIYETQRVVTALTAAGITPLTFKGWPLAARLSGSATARHAGDLDLLICPDQIGACCALLESLGYSSGALFKRESHIRDTKALAAEGKDIRLEHEETGMAVELHWRMIPYTGWPEIQGLPGAITTQTTQAGPLQVLSDQANMMYLPLHGGLHMWTRLKWLADIAPLARLRGPEGLAQDMALARDLGLTKPVSVGLKLSARLLGSPLPPGMTLGRPQALERFMLDTIARDDMTPTISPRYRIWARLNALRLAQGAGQVLGVIRYDTLRRWRWRLAYMGK